MTASTETPLEALIARLEQDRAEAFGCIDCGRLVINWPSDHRRGSEFKVADAGMENCRSTMRCIPNADALAALRARAALTREG